MKTANRMLSLLLAILLICGSVYVSPAVFAEEADPNQADSGSTPESTATPTPEPTATPTPEPTATPTPSASSSVTAKVTASSGLNLRKGAGTSYAVLLTIPYNQTVTVLDRSNASWYKVKYSTYTGFASSQYLKVLSTGTATPTPKPTATATPVPSGSSIGTGKTTAALRIRSGPGTSYATLGVLPSGTTVTVISKASGVWYKIRTSVGVTGYCSGDYLKVTLQTAQPSATTQPTAAPTTTATPKPTAAPTPAATTTVVGQVTARSGLNLRKGAGTSYAVLLTIPYNKTVTVLDRSNASWYKVKYGSSTGYVSSQYLKISTVSSAPSASPTPAAGLLGTAKTTAALRIRSGPGTSYATLGVLPSGTTVTLVKKASGVWYQVLTASGLSGYCSGDYLKVISTSASPVSTPAPETTIQDWHKTLVNAENPLPEGYNVTLATVSGNYQVDTRCLGYLVAMLNDCTAAGYAPQICSAYRTEATQRKLYENKVSRLMNTGMSRAQAEAEAVKSVAFPNTSEHQLGLAVDITDAKYTELDEAQENTATQKWLIANSWKYGFILRYPPNKTDVTGIIYEPWHYRYVGYALAKELHDSGLTLEEYLGQP